MAFNPYKNSFDIFDPDLIMYLGLVAAQKRNEDATKYISRIMPFGQKEFFIRSCDNDLLYQENCQELLSEALFKFDSYSLTVEQLHAIRNAKNYKIPPEWLSMLEGKNYDEFLHRALLDNALMEAQSFMEMYLRYVAFFSAREKFRYSNTYKMLEKIKASKSQIAKEAYEYLTSNVYSKCQKTDPKLWGDYLTELRNTTTHEKQLELSNHEVINPLGRSRTEITYQNQPIARFMQDIENNIVFMLHSMFQILYGLTWDDAREKIKQN